MKKTLLSTLLINIITVALSFVNVYLAALFFSAYDIGIYASFTGVFLVVQSLPLSGLSLPITRAMIAKNFWFLRTALIWGLCASVIFLCITVFGYFMVDGVNTKYWLAVLGLIFGPVLFVETYLIATGRHLLPRYLNLLAQLIILGGIMSSGSHTLSLIDIFLLSKVYLVWYLIVIFKERRVRHECEPPLTLSYFRQGLRQTILNIFLVLSARLDKIILTFQDPVLAAGLFYALIVPSSIKGQSKVVSAVYNVILAGEGPVAHWRQLRAHSVIIALLCLALIVATVGINFVLFYFVLDADLRYFAYIAALATLSIPAVVASMLLNHFLNTHSEAKYAYQIVMFRNLALLLNSALVLFNISIYVAVLVSIEVLVAYLLYRGTKHLLLICPKES